MSIFNFSKNIAVLLIPLLFISCGDPGRKAAIAAGLPLGDFQCPNRFGGNTYINGMDSVIIGLATNQVWIVARAEKVAENEFDLFYEAPEDLGRGGMDIEWDQISKTRPFGKLTVVDANTLVKADSGLYHMRRADREYWGFDWNLCDTIQRVEE